MTGTGEPIQIGGIKAKEIWIFGSFDNERVRQRDHGIILFQTGGDSNLLAQYPGFRFA